MAVKFILTLVLLQLVSAAPGPDPEPDPNVNIDIVQHVGSSNKGTPEPKPKSVCLPYTICNGTLEGSTTTRTGVCAPCSGYTGWKDMTKYGDIDHGCWSTIPHPPDVYDCHCYVNEKVCSSCTCTYQGWPGICVPIWDVGKDPLRNWRNHGNKYGCEHCEYKDCQCVTQPREKEPAHGPEDKCPPSICNGTMWGGVPVTGMCAWCWEYKGWENLERYGHVDIGCPKYHGHPYDKDCMCYTNGCSHCSCTVDMVSHGLVIPVPGICADNDHSLTRPIPDYWINHGHGYGCDLCSDHCNCYTPPE